MKTVPIGQSQSDEYKNKTIAGFYVLFTAQALVVNQALKNTDFLFRNTKINVDLKRGGKTESLLGTTFDVLLKTAHYQNEPIKASWAYNTALTAQSNLLAQAAFDGIINPAAAGSIQQILIAAPIYFPSVLELEHKDELMITVNASTGTLVTGSNASAGSATFFGFDVIPGVGIEEGLFKMEVQAIQQQQVTVNIAPGPGTKRILYVNTDNSSINASTAIISQMTYRSMKMGYTRLYTELLAVRSNEFPYYDDWRGQDFMLHDTNEDVHDVNIVLTLNTTQVTAGNNYIVTLKEHHTEHSKKLHGLKLQHKHLLADHHAGVLSNAGTHALNTVSKQLQSATLAIKGV